MSKKFLRKKKRKTFSLSEIYFEMSDNRLIGRLFVIFD